MPNSPAATPASATPGQSPAPQTPTSTTAEQVSTRLGDGVWNVAQSENPESLRFSQRNDLREAV